MKRLKSLSIFFPAFNEAENLPLVIGQALEVAPKITDKFEILVIDDGSTDSTVQVVEDIIKKNMNQKIKLIRHKKNLGYGAALKTGIYNSRYDLVTYMDSDGQFDFHQLNKLVERIDESDIVIGYRVKRADKLIRILNGKIWNFLVGLLLSLKVRDVDCGFKLFKRDVISKIDRLQSNGATISAELLVKAKKMGFKIVQVGLIHEPRKFGNATGGNPLHIFRAFYDLFVILPKIK